MFILRKITSSFVLTGNILELKPFSASRILAFLIDALKVMPSSINASNGPLIGAALIGTDLKFAEYVPLYKILTGNIFGLILKNKMAAMGILCQS